MTKCEPTGYTDTEVWWTCPKCGARNFGVYYSHARPCAKCDYEHPPAGEVSCLGDDELLRDKEIREHKARIERLQAILDDLLGEVNDLNEQMLRIARLACRKREEREDLESEIAAIDADLKEISTEYEDCKTLLKAAEDRQEVIQKTLRGERQPAPDQADLTWFKLCA